MSNQDRDTFSDAYIPPTSGPYDGIIDDIRAIEKIRSTTHLQANSLRSDIYKFLPNSDDVASMQQEIIDFLEGQQTLADRFGAMVHPNLAPYIGSVDLGRVQYPSGLEDFQSFEAEFCQLISQCTTPDNPVMRFKSSDPDCMLLHTTEMKHDSDGNKVVVVTRTRRLAEMDSPVDGDRIKIRKRMTFLLTDPHTFGRILEKPIKIRDGIQTKFSFDIWYGRLQRGLENAEESIIPISTVYFAYTEPAIARTSTV